MKTLEQLKNDYAETQGYGYWNELLLNNDSFTVGNLHLNKVMKIYAMECLELACENLIGDPNFSADTRNAITNENNLIK